MRPRDEAPRCVVPAHFHVVNAVAGMDTRGVMLALVVALEGDYIFCAHLPAVYLQFLAVKRTVILADEPAPMEYIMIIARILAMHAFRQRVMPLVDVFRTRPTDRRLVPVVFAIHAVDTVADHGSIGGPADVRIRRGE